MKKDVTVLIADRNPHVRKFLERELTAEGFTVITANSAHDLIQCSFGPARIDLLVMDPDFPDMGAKILLQRLELRVPPLPLIIHSLPVNEGIAEYMSDSLFFVEKGMRSIEELKCVITAMLPGLKASGKDV